MRARSGDPVMRRAVLAGIVLLLLTPRGARADVADFIGRPVASVTVRMEGEIVTEPQVLDLIETAPGAPLSMEDVRESLFHLFSLGRFQDVQVNASLAEAGVALEYDLVPLHAVTAIEFEGRVELPSGDLRQTLVARYGASPLPGRADDMAATLRERYRDAGYFNARVVPRAVVDHEKEETTLVFRVEAGSRARVGEVELLGDSPAERRSLLDRLNVSPGAEYDPQDLARRLTDHVDGLKAAGRYEAVGQHVASPRPGGELVDLTLTVLAGPLITLTFQGDPLPVRERERLVVVRQEGSVDEDLLEDSTVRIADYLRAQGYWRARASHSRTEQNGQVQIVFDVSRGVQYRVDAVEISGNASVPLTGLSPLVPLGPGDLFVESRLDAAVAAVRDRYLRLGYADVRVESSVAESPGAEGLVLPRIQIVEGPRTLVGTVAVEGNVAVPSAELRARVTSAPGSPFFRPQAAADRELLLVEYLDRGYQNAQVDLEVGFSDDRSRADLVFSVREGPQVLVDHILIVGNTRPRTATIERELLVKPGEPLGLRQVVESQQRLRALGLFRGVRITEVQHSDSTARDLLVTVEEAPATSIGYGGGLEGGKRLRRTGPDGQAEERLELAPRGFFEIGRRNLWGKNRSVDLFTRISVRPQDDAPDASQDGSLGFSEYRVLATYREPRAFGWLADAIVTGFLEQAIRSSFNFTRRGIHAEFARLVAPGTRLSGRFAFDRTKLFDERFNAEDQLLIDRLFPQVRLATVSSGLLRDTRNDPLDPVRGALIGLDAELAGRRIGSQVGFAKSLAQGFLYRRLPGTTGMVLALGARLGMAAGFARDAPTVDENGQPADVPAQIDEIPASERFFAGGDTTVRGFALDRLGSPETIDQDGFPKGGNGLIVLNTELRMPVWRDLGAVAFLDAGNVFATIADMTLGGLRGGAGVGLRYRSPIGPIRVDLGFKLDRRTFANGERESRSALHVSIGHAF